MKPRKTYWIASLLIWLVAIQTGWCFYNPQQGRWLSRDPIGEWGGLNLYAFVQNDPVSLFDYLGLAKKKCGVESFVVKWVGRGDIPNPELAHNPGALFKIWVKITFKNGGEFDQRCCEYKQNSGYKVKLTRGGQPIERNFPMKDDDYSRANDVDGNLDDSNFESNDFPGLPNVQEGDVIEFSFTAKQIVYLPGNNFAANKDKKLDACECEKNDEVAKRGPHTASVTGTYSKKLKYDDGVPKELK